MNRKLEKTVRVPVSGCDRCACATVSYLAELFMDAATEHCEALGITRAATDRSGLFWMVSRTKIRIHELPRYMDEVTASTWPAPPGKVRALRYYRLTKGKKLLAEGKNEWVLIDLQSGRPRKTALLYPSDLEHLQDVACDGAFRRFSSTIAEEEWEAFDTYRVRSTDIDIGGHMNNVAYIRGLFGAFSCREREETALCELEVAYKTQCYEGDILTLCRHRGENGADYAMLRENGTVAAFFCLSEA